MFLTWPVDPGHDGARIEPPETLGKRAPRRISLQIRFSPDPIHGVATGRRHFAPFSGPLRCSGSKVITVSAEAQNQSLFGERSTRVGFQIDLECQSLHLLWKCAVQQQPPRPVLCRMRGFSSVVIADTASQVFTRARVFLIRVALAAQDVHIPHHPTSSLVGGPKLPVVLNFFQPVFAFGCAGHASPSPSPRLRHAKPKRNVVPRGGIEPPTRGFSVRCSTN